MTEKRYFKKTSQADLQTPGEFMSGMLNHGTKIQAKDKPWDQAAITAQEEAKNKHLEGKGIPTNRSIQRERRGK